jgi:hypothetical protein
LATIVYIETNFLMSYATGRDLAIEELVNNSPKSLSLIIPSFCFMEAFSTFESERKRYNKFKDTLKYEIAQTKRNVISSHVQPLINHLKQAEIELGETFNEFEDRLHQAIFVLSMNAEIIEPTSQILQLSFYNRLIDKEPTDNLILASILHHADQHAGDIKILLTENRKDFESNTFAESAIQEAGIRYFADASKFLEWPRAQPES